MNVRKNQRCFKSGWTDGIRSIKPARREPSIPVKTNHNIKGGNNNEKVYRYDGEYGVLEVDLEQIKVVTDELDREKIWKDAREDYWEQQRIYSEIIDELFDEDITELFPPRHENEYWCGEPTDFGYMAFNDDVGVKIIVDAEGSNIYDQDDDWLVWRRKNEYINEAE